jgi:hypothetical protein
MRPEAPRPAGRKKQKRWGLRSLAYLALAVASIITSNALRLDDGVNEFALLTFIGTAGGLIGAAVCSVLGIRAGIRTWGSKVPRS